MALKERNQNPVVGDILNLRMFTYNSNHRQSVQNVAKVEIYQLDETCITQDNPEGRRLIGTIEPTDIEIVPDSFGGHYKVTIGLVDQVYTIGNYLDVWYVQFNENQSGTVTNEFKVISDLWYASDMPIVYDFSYGFRPNRIRKGERRWLTVEVVPNVPNASDLQRYYMNLAVASPVKIHIEKKCGECVPAEKDLRTVVSGGQVEYRRDAEGYFFLDTVDLDMDCGIYDVWFELDFGESTYISENLQLQVF
jgi:hypothetical protein